MVDKRIFKSKRTFSNFLKREFPDKYIILCGKNATPFLFGSHYITHDDKLKDYVVIGNFTIDEFYSVCSAHELNSRYKYYFIKV